MAEFFVQIEFEETVRPDMSGTIEIEIKGENFTDNEEARALTIKTLERVKAFLNHASLVESKAGIIPRSSLLNLGVRLSPHPASDVLSFRVCSCEYNRGSFHE